MFHALSGWCLRLLSVSSSWRDAAGRSCALRCCPRAGAIVDAMAVAGAFAEGDAALLPRAGALLESVAGAFAKGDAALLLRAGALLDTLAAAEA